MIFLGICDICSTFVHSITTGIFGIMGVVYCDFPLVIFILGSLGLGSWMGCCVSSIVLAVIRAGDVDSNRWIMRIFDGLKIYIVLGICLAYFLITIFLVKPVVFNENYSSWFTDPGLGHDPALYKNSLIAFNNFAVAICTIVFYGYISYVYLKKSKSGNSSTKLTKSQLSILLQTFFFCFFHAVTSLIYVYMDIFQVYDMLIFIAHFGWQCSSGAVCVVYLTLNNSIRQTVKKLFCTPPVSTVPSNMFTVVI
ncbi:Serpentine Receptor, class T [Caenorhabditis elegans]|nr:Serpentine Receptor, class T [Caenorhabditis elegans]CTQ86811.1 Serpentine Receptor, class T [Caenorhabditis elegans]|eukprot:NP_001300112.1 Serpentine Receptor, class T [Caenorhabditis elegans]